MSSSQAMEGDWVVSLRISGTTRGVDISVDVNSTLETSWRVSSAGGEGTSQASRTRTEISFRASGASVETLKWLSANEGISSRLSRMGVGLPLQSLSAMVGLARRRRT